MALSTYAVLKVFVNGNPLTQLIGVDVTQDGGRVRVDLMEVGLAGWTPGPGSTNVALRYAVPIGGPEENFSAMCHTGEFVDLQVFQGALSYAGRGIFKDAAVKGDVGSSTEGSCTFEGEFKPFE